MRYSKRYGRKHRKISRKRRGGQERPALTRQSTAELKAMEEGVNSLYSEPVNEPDSLNYLEEGRANPSVSIDIASTKTTTPDIEMGKIGGKRRKSRRHSRSKNSRKHRK
jgi:hypothetical protein